jgi:Ca2+-binding EF-hand superfamily protein
MQDFIHQNALKKAALSFIAIQASDRDIYKLKKVFMDIDVNGDGYITVSEIA